MDAATCESVLADVCLPVPVFDGTRVANRAWPVCCACAVPVYCACAARVPCLCRCLMPRLTVPARSSSPPTSPRHRSRLMGCGNFDIIFDRICSSDADWCLQSDVGGTPDPCLQVVYVIDAGFVKMKGYSPVAGLESLVVAPISKASARQLRHNFGPFHTSLSALYPKTCRVLRSTSWPCYSSSGTDWCFQSDVMRDSCL